MTPDRLPRDAADWTRDWGRNGRKTHTGCGGAIIRQGGGSPPVPEHPPVVYCSRCTAAWSRPDRRHRWRREE